MRLTSREKEIYEVLKKEPLISQDELARRFGITRSSVAVHISNLMKKGVILGKGYVFNEQVSIVVIGESYMKIDIKGQQDKPFIDVGYGGFGLEVGKVFSNFGINIKLITLIGNDELSTKILDELQNKSIDTVNIFKHAEKRTSRKVFINGVVNYEENFSPADFGKAIDAREWVVFNCEWLLVEPQFQEAVYRKSVGKDEEKLPYLCTYRRLNFPEEIPEYLAKFTCLVLGADSQSLDFYAEKAGELLKDVNQNWIITDGKTRLLYCSSNTQTDFPLLPNQSILGDEGLSCLLAGLVYGISSSYPVRQAVRIAIGTASVN